MTSAANVYGLHVPASSQGANEGDDRRHNTLTLTLTLLHLLEAF
jgi:hypothetical protein